MKKRKIIHIAGPSSALQTICIEPDSDDYITWAWSTPVAYNTLKFTNKYDLECWRSEPDIKKPITHKIDGIVFKVFPCFRLKGVGAISPTMLKALKKSVRNNEILLHLHHLHSMECCFISYLFKDCPIVVQHHGTSSPIVIFKREKNPLYLLGYYLIERPTFKYVDHFFALRKNEMTFLSNFIGANKITLQTMGIDFDEFKPINKVDARTKLNIPLNKKVIIYIGKYYKLKGVDVILEAFRRLNEKYDVKLILIGGTNDDEFYNDAKTTGARVYGFLPHDVIPLYLNIADVYLLPAFDERYMGIDVSTAESLACGVPIVSTTLKDFPTDEWKQLGKIPKNEDDVVKCVSDIFDDPSPYKNCREVARKYYDWKPIIENTLKIYDKLFREYYE